MDYDTWKTTDTEHEEKCAADDAFDKAQSDFADDLFDAYMLDNTIVINEIDLMIMDEDVTEALIKILRENYEPLVRGKVRGPKLHKAYEDFIYKQCKEIADKAKNLDDIWKLAKLYKV